jgi:hypothetical protein
MKTILLLLTFTLGAFAQDCVHTNLSKDFDFKINTKHFLGEGHDSDSVDVTVTAISKIGNKSHNIHFGTRSFYDDSYLKCSNVRSYSTGFNKNNEVADNDYGDLVVADFNFDGKDDFALKYNGWGNSGPGYNFYVQQSGGSFAKDAYLTDSVFYFPQSLNVKKKQLIVGTRAGANGVHERTYQYNAAKNSWHIARYLRLQGRNFNELSKRLNFSLAISDVVQKNMRDSVYLAVEIMDKNFTVKQTINFGTEGYAFPFEYFGQARSYSTGFNKGNKVLDNDYGDLIVADFNFDGLEDLAVKREQGGNGGPIYNYYVQDKNGLFALQEFLSNQMQFFPDEFIASKKQLITRVRANTYQYSETHFDYLAPPTGDGWRMLKTQMKDWN